MAGVLTSGDPSVVLKQGSLLQELSGNQNPQTRQLGTAARQLGDAEQQIRRTGGGVAALRDQLTDRKNSLGKLIATQKAMLTSLAVRQQLQVRSNTIDAGGTTTATYTGPTSTQAGKAVASAYYQLGKPYQWGATGPGSCDCSASRRFLIYASFLEGRVLVT